MTEHDTATIGPENLELSAFVDRVHGLIGQGLDEAALTAAVRDELSARLAGGLQIPESKREPDPDRYVMYPLYVAPDGSFSIASAVWDVGQGTPVHGHETWGVVGIYSGVESETRFAKPSEPDVALTPLGTHAWTAGQVTVCCTTDDDVHQVRCGGDEPVVGVHVYGANIGSLQRRAYDPETGAVRWFVSDWAQER
jgi:predicted metal-dependent enzyme (double-stranded beta helix superfamily)